MADEKARLRQEEKDALQALANDTVDIFLEEQAKKDNRSLANYVITVLMRHLKEQGISWGAEEQNKRLESANDVQGIQAL